MRDLILASGSSRRHSLIDKLNLEYRVCVSNVDESIVESELPEEYVCRMARVKAQAISKAVSQGIFQPNSQDLTMGQVILAADTIVVLDGEILGKPKNIQHAKIILQKLSNTEHDVLTALHLETQEDEYQILVRSSVKFKLLDDNEIEAYCLTSEPYDKAGAYAIQGAAASFVEYLSGSYTNVVGLPLFAVSELLKKCEIL
jgi:septum formation protein